MPGSCESVEEGTKVVFSPAIIVRLYYAYSLHEWKRTEQNPEAHLDETDGVSQGMVVQRQKRSKGEDGSFREIEDAQEVDVLPKEMGPESRIGGFN